MARTQVVELQASERRILVQLYCMQSEAWEHREASGIFTMDSESESAMLISAD